MKSLILFFTYRAYQILENSISVGSVAWTPLATPLVIPQVPWVLGFAFFAFCLILMLLRSVRALARGDLATVERISAGTTGGPEVDDEVITPVERKVGGGNEC